MPRMVRGLSEAKKKKGQPGLKASQEIWNRSMAAGPFFLRFAPLNAAHGERPERSEERKKARPPRGHKF